MAFTWDDPERPQRGGASGDPYANGGTTPITLPPHTIAPPNGGSAAGLPHGTPPATGSGSSSGDPARDAVMAAFAKKGITPNDGEVDYWLGKIKDTGGWDKPDNQSYWLSRMAQDQGGVGDRQGRPETGGADALGSLIAPFTEQFTNPNYVAPTGVNDSNDPGFSARMSAADDALQRSAAAKGSLLSGSTLKALSDWNSDYASNEYAQVDSRARQTYATNSQNAYQQYAQRRANFYQNQDSPFAKLFGLAQLDSSNQNQLNQLNLGYAGLGASTLQNPYYGNYLTQGANATAAGQAGAGSAYANAFSSAGQVPFQYAAYRSLFPSPSSGFPGWPGSQGGG